MRDSCETLQVDNELFSHNNAKFLRKLLRIAGQKKDRWWYVASVLGDTGARGTLDKAAPRDEVQFYESIVKRIPKSTPDARSRHSCMNGNDSTSESDGVLSDHGSHDFDEQAAAIINRKHTKPHRRPSTACAIRKLDTPTNPSPLPRPHSALPYRTTPQTPTTRPSSACGRTPEPYRRPQTATTFQRVGMGGASPKIARGKPRPKSALSRGGDPGYRDALLRHKVGANFVRRGSDVELLRREGRAVQVAAGLCKPDEADPTAGGCWTRTNGAVKRVKDMVDSVEVFMAGAHADDIDQGLEIDEKWALHEMGNVPSNDQISAASAESSGEDTFDEIDAIHAKRDRQQTRRDNKFETKLKKANEERGLPPNTLHATIQEETPMVVTPAPQKIINGHPAAIHEDYTMRLERKPSLHGGANVFSDGSVVSELRAVRWRPCLDAMNNVETAIFKLEKCWSDRRKSDEEVEHPPAITAKEKDSLLHQGMGCEGDEASALLTKWGGDLEQRLKVLIMYEAIAAQQLTSTEYHTATEHIATQTDESSVPLGERTGNVAVNSSTHLTKPVVEAGGGGATTTAKVKTRKSPSVASVMVGSHGLSTAGFIHKSAQFANSTFRSVAASRVQSAYRGYRDRVLVGNVKKGVLTFFHSRDVRIREAWLAGSRRAARGGEEKRPPTWLTSLLTTILNSKITSNYLCDSQKKPRVEFINFIYEHLTDSLQDETVVNATIESALLMLDKQIDSDLIFAVVCNFLFCIWGAAHANLLSTAMCAVHSVTNKLSSTNNINPNCVIDSDLFLSSAQTKQVIRQVFSNKRNMASLQEDVIRKCKTLEALQQQGGGISADARKDMVQNTKGKKTDAKGVTVTQKELYYALLLTATPDLLAEHGYAR